VADQVVARPTGPSNLERWFPIGAWLPKYDGGSSFAPDLIAAISVAALLIPESMGYPSVAGVPAQIGLHAAPLALIGYALFGGSRRSCWPTQSAGSDRVMDPRGRLLEEDA
jgi:sulfate permease, SulP family